MARFKLPKTPNGAMNFSIVRANGDTLSFAADDSCGAFKHDYRRTYLQAFDVHGNDLAPELCGITPEQYLTELAAFLGYRIEKL